MSTTISGPGFFSIQVRDLAAAADFYEHKVGLKRNPFTLPGVIAFESTPIPFAVRQQAPGVSLDNLSNLAIWLKAVDGQAAHDSLSEADVTILKPPFDGPFGRMFIFADLDGYPVTVYELDEPILDRLPPTP